MTFTPHCIQPTTTNRTALQTTPRFSPDQDGGKQAEEEPAPPPLHAVARPLEQLGAPRLAPALDDLAVWRGWMMMVGDWGFGWGLI
jgi:hypothetical protein